MAVFQLSAKTGEGMERYLEFLATSMIGVRSAAVV